MFLLTVSSCKIHL